MLSQKYKKPLNLSLKPSKYLLYFIVLIHLLAISVLFLNLDIHLILKIILFVLVIISLYLNLKKSNSIAFQNYIKNIEYQKDMQWMLVSSNQKLITANLQQNWFVLSWLVILYFKIDSNKNIITIILPDMIEKNDFRLLKLHLRQIR